MDSMRRVTTVRMFMIGTAAGAPAAKKVRNIASPTFDHFPPIVFIIRSIESLDRAAIALNTASVQPDRLMIVPAAFLSPLPN